MEPLLELRNKKKYIFFVSFVVFTANMKTILVAACLWTLGWAGMMQVPHIPRISALKGPTLDDLVKQQEQKRRETEMAKWKYPQVHH